MHRRRFIARSAAALAAAATGCTRFADLTVGSKNFTEQLILGEILAQHLRRRLGRKVDGRFYLAGSYICHQAMLAGRIDTYVEYTGTALAAILKAPRTPDRASVYEQVRRQYRDRFGLEVFPSLGFDNSFAMIMRSEDAARMRLRKLSDLAAASSSLKMGVGYEFLDRADGYKGLVAAYGLRFAAPPQVMDLGLLYRALLGKQVDMIAGANTDGQIEALKLTVLDDDRSFFPPYEAVPIVRSAALAKVPGLEQAVRDLTGRISASAMRRMNYQADSHSRDAAAIAHDFLAGLETTDR